LIPSLSRKPRRPAGARGIATQRRNLDHVGSRDHSHV
jgi:hypothetical protein